jgi:nucleoside 2-deoxyribosyltransferase
MIASGLKPGLYFAAPLFSSAELSFNQQLAGTLASWFDVYLPQRDGGLLIDLVRRGVDVDVAYESIFRRDMDALRESSVCLMVLDGRSVDEGASFELGVAYSLGKVCIGLQTDARRLLPLGNNPMVQCALRHVFHDADGLLEWAMKFLVTDVAASDI